MKEDILIREPKISDLKKLLIYINKLSKERTFVIYQGEEISEKSERKWLKNKIQNSKDGKGIVLVAFYKDELVGISEITLGHGSREHLGGFGISVDKKYRGKGIGSMLMDKILFEAKLKLKKLRIIYLDVFSDNHVAVSMYEKKGFIKCGELPEGSKRKGKYVAEASMYKKI